jgi:pyruvate/2-oxoglutarate dehydrogenase complex dihydrolipoamide dehydrogenase (E3) component
MAKYDYDVIVIGGGAGGLVSSKLAAGLGKKTALIERNKIGGECSWSGCVPSKALIKAAHVAHDINTSAKYSIGLDKSVSVDGNNVMQYVQSIIETIDKFHDVDDIEKAGVKVFFGSAKFIDRNTIDVDGKQLTAGKFILSTGTSAFVPPIPGIDSVPFLTNESIFDIKKMPASMLVLGGGAIGIEMAQSFLRLGVQVTVVEMNDTILFRDDLELAGKLSEMLVNEGLDLKTGTKAVTVSGSAGKINLEVEKKDGSKETLRAESLLVAVGRVPNIEPLDPEAIGLKTTRSGVVVNSKMQTSVTNIYACGDVAGPYQFSHMAEYQAVIAGMNACLPITKKADYTNVLWVTFSDPELAHVGMTEEEARAKYGNKISVITKEYGHNDRAITENTPGFAKYIINKKGYLLGAHILGKNAGELIHEAQLLRTFKIPLYKIQTVIHAYPTFSDITRQAGKTAYLERIQNNPIVKLAKSFKK